MADITVRNTGLKHLKCCASELAAAVESLATLLEQEAARLQREEEVACLKALRSTILERVQQEKKHEMAAKNGCQIASGVGSMVRLAAGLVTMTFEDERMQALSRSLLAGPSRRETRFGTVLVSIGPKGLPDDAQAVSVSELARRSNRQESQVISELRERGYLLLSEEAFTRLIDRLTDDVQEGRLTLPVPTEKLPETQTSRWVKLETDKPRLLPRSELPQNPQPSP